MGKKAWEEERDGGVGTNKKNMARLFKYYEPILLTRNCYGQRRLNTSKKYSSKAINSTSPTFIIELHKSKTKRQVYKGYE